MAQGSKGSQSIPQPFSLKINLLSATENPLTSKATKKKKNRSLASDLQSLLAVLYMSILPQIPDHMGRKKLISSKCKACVHEHTQ